MVKSKKTFILIALMLVLLFTPVGAIRGVTRYYEINVGESKDLNAGQAGVTFFKANYIGRVKLTRVSRNAAPGEPNFSIT